MTPQVLFNRIIAHRVAALASCLLILTLGCEPREAVTAENGQSAAGEQRADATESTAPVAFDTAEESYTAGDSVELQLLNESGDRPLEYNLCFSTLQREADGGWEPATLPGGGELTRTCPAIARILEPGMSATYTMPLDSTLAGGRYRYMSDVRLSGSQTDRAIYTSAFEIASL